MTMTRPVSLVSLATAVPEHCLYQSDAMSLADMLFSDRYDEFERLKPVFSTAGITKRHIGMPIEWYLEPRDWEDRNKAYIEVAADLFVTASKRALNEAGHSASEIDVVVTVSSTGIATPTLEARALGSLGLRSDILRVPLFGLGCAGGVTGLSIAQRIARAQPGTTVLLVVVELCSLAFRLDKLNKPNIVATALFGDGAAAAIVSSASDGNTIELLDGCQHTWPETLDTMGWKVDPNGFEVVFDRSIPPFARRHLRPVIEDFLDRLEIDRRDLSRLTFHPGGMKVLQAIENAFELQDGTLDVERRVLEEYGNMSAPTALFVLKRALEDGLGGLSLLTALGPGFTAASTPLRVQ